MFKVQQMLSLYCVEDLNERRIQIWHVPTGQWWSEASQSRKSRKTSIYIRLLWSWDGGVWLQNSLQRQSPTNSLQSEMIRKGGCKALNTRPAVFSWCLLQRLYYIHLTASEYQVFFKNQNHSSKSDKCNLLYCFWSSCHWKHIMSVRCSRSLLHFIN